MARCSHGCGAIHEEVMRICVLVAVEKDAQSANCQRQPTKDADPQDQVTLVLTYIQPHTLHRPHPALDTCPSNAAELNILCTA